ncbi:AI-2E family transporter [bacterium]|nr:AI-2E family transporter [bacterium]
MRGQDFFLKIRTFAIPVAIWALIAWIVISIDDAVFPLASGFSAAYLLNPLVRFLTKFNIPRWLAVWIVFLLMMTLLFVVSIFVLPGIVMELFHFFENAPRYLTRSYYQLMNYLSRNGLGSIVWRYNLLPLLQQLGAQYVNSIIGSVTSSAQSLSGKISATASSLINISLFPIFLYYGLARLHLIPGQVKRILPPKLHDSFKYFLRISDAILSGYIRGQLIVCVSLGTLYAVGLWIWGVPYGLIIGYISGFLNLVPYLGFAGGILIGVLTVLISGGNVLNVLAVIGVFIVAQMIESFILTPKIVGGTVGLDPLLTLIALIVGGNVWGGFGLLIAVPVTGIINRIYKDYLLGRLTIKPMEWQNDT